MTILTVNAKGGVGKSLVSSNLAFGLAQSGKKTELFDTDSSSTHRPFWYENEFQSENLTVSGLEGTPSATPPEFVIKDTGPGIHVLTRELLADVALILLVTTPEPESLRLAVRSVQACLAANPRIDVGIVTNMTQGPAAGSRLANRLSYDLTKHLSVQSVFSVHVPWDPLVVDSRVRQVLLSHSKPKARASRALLGLAQQVQSYTPDTESLSLLPQLRVDYSSPEAKAA